MEKRSLGASNLSPTVLGLGTMTFGDESDEATSHAILDRYVEAGGTLIDTADVYSQGSSEEIIGRWLSDRGMRDELSIATKGRFAMGQDPADRGAGHDYLERALEASLGRLGIDVIDLYQMHAWDPNTPIEETLETLNGFVVSGKVRAIGVSNYTGWQLERAIMAAKYEGWAPLVSLQPQYSLLSREIELEVLPVCLEESLGVLPWSPLAGGWLTGKYRPDDRPSGSTRLGEDPNRGVEAYDIKNTETTWRVLSVVRSIAERRNVAMSQVALNWLRTRPGVTSILLGCRTVEQLDDNLSSLAWNLSPDETEALNMASAPGIPLYPHGFLESYADVDIWERLETRNEAPLGSSG